MNVREGLTTEAAAAAQDAIDRVARERGAYALLTQFRSRKHEERRHLMHEAQCCSSLQEYITPGEKTGVTITDDGTWAIWGCCHGGCYVLDKIAYCPFCGTPLPRPAP